MNIRDLRYAVAVAELGHFGRAAVACHVSQPALSGQIRKLEDTLGVVLFERSRRSVRVTPAGRQVLEHAREVLERVDRMRASARGWRDPLSGPLHLGLIPTVAPYLAPLLLPAVRRSLPKAELVLSEDLTKGLERALFDGRLDAAVLATPVEDPRFANIDLYDEPFWVALPGTHRLAARDEVALSEIGTDEFLLLSEGHCLRGQILSLCSRVLSHPPSIRAQHTSLVTVLALVGAGEGVTLVPAMSISGPWVTDAGIALRREKSAEAGRSVRLVYRKSFPRCAVLEKLADIICAIVPDTVRPERR